jgi:hypothetical protein
MGQSQLTIVDALSDGVDPLLSFPPETGAETRTAPRIRQWSQPRGFVEIQVPPLACQVIAVGTTRERRTAFYQRWAPRVGRIPYIVFVLGVAVGAFARGTTRSHPDSAMPPRTPQRVIALPASMSGSQLQPDSASPRGTAGSGPSIAVDTKAAVPESARSLPAASGGRPSRHLGTLRVDSTPRGAEVRINGNNAGRTPLVLRALPVGSRAVRVSLDGYAVWSRGIRIVAGEATTVSARLDRKQ